MPEDVELPHPDPTPKEATYTPEQLATGLKLYEKLSATRGEPNTLIVGAVANARGRNISEAWSVDTGIGRFSAGPIYAPAPPDPALTFNAGYQVVDDASIERLGVCIRSQTVDGVARPFFFEVDADGRIKAYVAIEQELTEEKIDTATKYLKNYTLAPIAINYDALPVFIDRSLNSSPKT